MDLNNQKIDIWDLDNKINIKINEAFLDFINLRIKAQFTIKRNIYNILSLEYPIPFSTFKSRIKKSYRYFIDLDILFNLCKILGISSNELQKNIIAYKTRRGNNYIENPKLPIKISPIFDMLIAHHMGDGNVVNPKGRKPYFSYRQYNVEYRKLYIKKIECLFGNPRYKKDYLYNSTQIYYPIVISDILFRFYGLNINSFKSELARIPKQIFHKKEENKLAFLIAIIIDEGSIDSSLILIRMKNKLFISDLKNLCMDLKYKTSMTKGKEGMYNLYILSQSLRKFYNDYKQLLMKFPEANLGYKGEKIEEFIKRLNKRRRRNPLAEP